jgi:quercetin dioxygenase-like cupin family protein
MKLAHLTTTEDGGSRFSEIEIRLGETAPDPWGNVVSRSEMFPLVGSMVIEMPDGLMMDWHASARPSFIVVLSGTVESETTDGAKRSWTAGQMFFTDDRGGSGHRTRTIGGPALLLFLYPPVEPEADR